MPLPPFLNSLEQPDIDRLVANSEQEGTHLDLKRSLPSNWDSSAKHEFLADVSAFANAGGGDLVFGVDEDGEGRAATIVPQLINPDTETRRLQDFLLNGVEPRIPACIVVAVPVTVGNTTGSVIVVRAPKSWSGPHRVRTNQHFFLREGARKRQLDVPELRGLFFRTEARAQRVRDFRTDRISKILMGDTPCRLASGAVMVLHLIPTEAALDAMAVDPVQYVGWAAPNPRRIPMLTREAGGNVRLNLDGAVCTMYAAGTETNGYSTLFRNGFLEAAKVYSSAYSNTQNWLVLPSQEFESVCIGLVRAFRAELAHLGVGAEMVAMFSLLDANRVMMGIDRFSYGLSAEDGRFDRQHVLLPDVVLPPEISPERALRPVFDLVWQSSGLARSLNYDEVGEWAPRR